MSVWVQVPLRVQKEFRSLKQSKSEWQTRPDENRDGQQRLCGFPDRNRDKLSLTPGTKKLLKGAF
ncbi:MAG: hypothetical protein JW894_06545 [Bacteroidales bacterium]|nr:hypothetical protein [Bacteroidales bacterium]